MEKSFRVPDTLEDCLAVDEHDLTEEQLQALWLKIDLLTTKDLNKWNKDQVRER